MLQNGRNRRDLAMFNLAIDSKVRGCDVVAIKVEDAGAIDGAASVPIENALFHCHARERESGGNVRRGTWAWLYLN